MMKKIAFILFIAALVLSSCKKDSFQETIQLGAADFTISSNLSISDKNKSESSLLPFYQDTDYQYELAEKGDLAGILHIKQRKIDNGDQLVFMQLEGMRENAISAAVSLSFDSGGQADFIDWAPRVMERPHDKNTGDDRATQPIGLFKLNDDDSSELVLSKQQISSPHKIDYGDDLSSQIRILHDEKKPYRLEEKDDQTAIQFKLSAEKGKLAEQWFMLSKGELFTKSQEHENWINYQIDSYKEANGWLTVGGPMKKLPWSIEPYTKHGYGRNLGVMVDREAIDRYISTKERYYYNLMINSAADLYEYRKEKGTKIWETEYTSTWLKNAYGLTAPYIDTRHNEFIGLYLAKIGEELGSSELMKARLHYADYLLGQIKEGNVIKVDDGLLIADYFSPYDQKQKTHASMNHVLGGANLLLDCYEQSGEEKYLEAAKKIRQAIENLGTAWIRENGDLWYQVNPDLTFAGNDYEQLTVVDLLKHQRNWESIGENRSPVIDQLIESKANYLGKEKAILLDEVKEELDRQGFSRR
ncbi:hypothetical protein LG291_23425 [Cytobacillus firmus]|uniref:hypothetical protein n=1 Tax=Cytobacillus firmus TaxID=1399 RepID=UPI00384E872E